MKFFLTVLVIIASIQPATAIIPKIIRSLKRSYSTNSILHSKFKLVDSVKLNNGDDCLNTPLHHAAKFDDPRYALFMLEQGIDYTKTNSEGMTALEIARNFNHDRTAQAIKLFTLFHSAEESLRSGFDSWHYVLGYKQRIKEILLKQYKEEKEELLSHEQE